LFSEQAQYNKNSSEVFYWFTFKTHWLWVSFRYSCKCCKAWWWSRWRVCWRFISPYNT